MSRLHRWTQAFGGSRSVALLVLSASWSLPGCYGFAGGGLPTHIKTVAILPFDNQTAEPALTEEVSQAVQTAMEGRLGLRIASEATADAVVRGTITRYEPDLLLAHQADAEGVVQVTRRRVQLTLNVEIYDQQEGKTLWQRGGLVVDGEYTPPLEINGRQLALEKLVNDIVDGAQSQW
ncbi:MAG: LptE family protein [Gemmatimonadota bacterium]|nr:MAG: LptE family protein [Gemmatimonadota bacterium]